MKKLLSLLICLPLFASTPTQQEPEKSTKTSISQEIPPTPTELEKFIKKNSSSRDSFCADWAKKIHQKNNCSRDHSI